jgi:broad specificity phosphatase PhoE
MLKDLEFNLYLVRHGESEVNVQPDLMGQGSDVPLTNRGREQAKLLGKWFDDSFIDFDHIFSSHYKRALDTAKIATGLNKVKIVGGGQGGCGKEVISVSPELREYDAGDWTGCSRSATLTPDVRKRMNIMNHAFIPPNGESLHMVERRAAWWLENNILYNKKLVNFYEWTKANKQDPPNILVFSHGMTIKSLLHYVMGFDMSFTWKINIDNTSITHLYFGLDGWRLVGINHTPHLQ